jgi:prepilin-type N-terminal cleavage/methylation domain-containing protein
MDSKLRKKNTKKISPRLFAFSLVEMLAVIAVIAILTSFTIVAFQGTSGAKGFRGGLDSFLSAMDLAKQTAEDLDVDVFVGFPPNDFGSTSDVPHSRFILFREFTYDEMNDPNRNKSKPPFVPLSRWTKLPPGILADLSTMDFKETALKEDYQTILPKLEERDVANLRLIQYNRHGSIVNKPVSQKNLFVLFGEGAAEGGNVKIFGKNSANLTVSRLTGKWSINQK